MSAPAALAGAALLLAGASAAVDPPAGPPAGAHVELHGELADVPALVDEVRALRARDPAPAVLVFIRWWG